MLEIGSTYIWEGEKALVQYVDGLPSLNMNKETNILFLAMVKSGTNLHVMKFFINGKIEEIIVGKSSLSKFKKIC